MDAPHALILLFMLGNNVNATAYPTLFNNEIDCKWAGVRWAVAASEKGVMRPSFVCVQKFERGPTR